MATYWNHLKSVQNSWHPPPTEVRGLIVARASEQLKNHLRVIQMGRCENIRRKRKLLHVPQRGQGDPKKIKTSRTLALNFCEGFRLFFFLNIMTKGLSLVFNHKANEMHLDCFSHHLPSTSPSHTAWSSLPIHPSPDTWGTRSIWWLPLLVFYMVMSHIKAEMCLDGPVG